MDLLMCFLQCYKYRVSEYIIEGPKINYRIYRQKCPQTSKYIDNLKKYKNIQFFQFSKHLKQQEHQINTLLHDYGNTIDI